jgi:hypothetical protein
MSRYNAEISAGSLLVAESRKLAGLMLGSPTPAQWDAAIKQDNILQRTPATARRMARLIRNRLETLDVEGLELVATGDAELCVQMLMAAAIRHSCLLGDFMRDVYAQDLRQLERHLSHRQWDAFLADCEQQDAAVASWAATTRLKLFQVIVRILAEAKYLDSSKTMGLIPPLLHPRVRSYLFQLGDLETLQRMDYHQ